jgi:hypothetical protein
MKRWIPLAALVAFLQGCATQLVFLPETASQDPDRALGAYFQTFRSSPPMGMF